MIKLLLCIMLCLSSVCAQAAKQDVVGYIGCKKLTFSTTAVRAKAEFTVDGPADYVAITEVFPDKPEPASYQYTVSVSGTTSYRRVSNSKGFGPTTYFIRVPEAFQGKITLRNAASTPVLISRVYGITNAELNALRENDDFPLMGLVPTGDADKWVKVLAEGLPSDSTKHVGRGFTYEVYYGALPADGVRKQLESCARWAKQYSMQAMPGLVSWWGGTPLSIPDGQGGKFGDIKYQQVCYSPDVEVPENSELRSLVGDRYDHHYGLSVPNLWSDTPWLTMNSTLLNAYRFRRMYEAIGMLREAGDKDLSWLSAIFLENEPRYWDTDCEAGNPKTNRMGKTLWADFNPMVIADAKKNGVSLNPVDGLSTDELTWLFRNVGKYNQDTVDSARKALKKHGYASDLVLYTHSLQHQQMFPGTRINHAASEFAYVKGARTGLEGLWSMPSDYYRVREWGKWSNLNREENDGKSIDIHLWDLRVSYMMGSELYNSYNWNNIGAERVFDYMKEFLRGLPVASAGPESVAVVGPGALRIKTPMKLQAFDRISIPMDIAGSFRGELSLALTRPDGEVYTALAKVWAGKAGRQTVEFDFTTPAESKWDQESELRLEVVAGEASSGSVSDVRFAPDCSNHIMLSLDLSTQRALSQAVIQRATR